MPAQIKLSMQRRSILAPTLSKCLRVRHLDWHVLCAGGPPLEAAVHHRGTPTFGGERGLGEIEEAQPLVEATHLLNQVGDSWNERGEQPIIPQLWLDPKRKKWIDCVIHKLISVAIHTQLQTFLMKWSLRPPCSLWALHGNSRAE